MEEVKIDDKDDKNETLKPKLIDKLKKIRWTFKVKNNLTRFITVEPLLCFYMLHIFMLSLIEPYNFHKACVSLNRDTYFCDIVTHIGKKGQEPCAEYFDQKLYCNSHSEKDPIPCVDKMWDYKYNETGKIFVSPEDYRFCTVIRDTMRELESDTDSLIDIFAIVLQFLVVMIVSIWSDKYSKRKMCILLPLFGQLAVTIAHLHGALSSYLSFEFIKIFAIFIDSLSGGMVLLLYGCFTYMSNARIKRNLLIRFGVLSFILTILIRRTRLYKLVYNYYHDDNAFINLISIALDFNILCLLYVKVILSEVKPDPVTKPSDGLTEPTMYDSQFDDASNGNLNNSSTKIVKIKKLAKALSLDVIWDYFRIIFKKRIGSGRVIIVLFVIIIFMQNCSISGFRMSVKLNHLKISTTDIDGAIFILISLMMIMLKISEAVIVILLISLSTLTRVLLIIFGIFNEETWTLGSNTSDFYSPFKTITSCCILLAFVDKTETRIFLIVQAIAHLPKLIFALVSYKYAEDIIIHVFDLEESDFTTAVMIPFPLIIFAGLGLFYYLAKANVNSIKPADPASIKHEITEKQLQLIKEDNYKSDHDDDIDGAREYQYIENTHM